MLERSNAKQNVAIVAMTNAPGNKMAPLFIFKGQRIEAA